MDLLKETTIETIKQLPDGCSAEEGRTITTEELLARVKQWGK